MIRGSAYGTAYTAKWVESHLGDSIYRRQWQCKWMETFRSNTRADVKWMRRRSKQCSNDARIWERNVWQSVSNLMHCCLVKTSQDYWCRREREWERERERDRQRERKTERGAGGGLLKKAHCCLRNPLMQVALCTNLIVVYLCFVVVAPFLKIWPISILGPLFGLYCGTFFAEHNLWCFSKETLQGGVNPNMLCACNSQPT